jgi:hypothetical protein
MKGLLRALKDHGREKRNHDSGRSFSVVGPGALSVKVASDPGWYMAMKSPLQNNHSIRKFHYLKNDGVSFCCKWMAKDLHPEKAEQEDLRTEEMCKFCLIRKTKYKNSGRSKNVVV